MRKLAVKWVPKCLYANQKCDHVLASQAILEHFRQNTAGFLPPLVIIDETWTHLYDPETKNNLRDGDTEVHLIQKSFESFFESQPTR